MSTFWITIIIVVALAMVISQLNTFRKNAAQPLRKKGLNDRQETLPRSTKQSKK